MHGDDLEPHTDRPPDLRWTFRVKVLFALILPALVMVQPVAAQMTPPGFGAYKHVRWSTDDGAPGTTYKIVQTPDGYLWLAGDALFRFDGVTFERIEWPSGTRKRTWPSEVMVSRRGELWVGLSNKGGILVYRGGRLIDVQMPDPLAAVNAMAQTPDGTIWVASGRFDGQLRRLRGTRWESVGDTLGLPMGAVSRLVATPQGGLWASLSHQDGETGSLAYLAPHAARFREIPARLGGRPKIALDPNGALWVSDTKGTRILIDSQGKPPASTIRFPPLSNVRTAWPVFDRNAGIWGTTASVGIFHIPAATTAPVRSQVYHFGAANGLTSDTTYQPFLDREGSVWIATEGGIDQFRRASAIQELEIPDDPVHGLAIASATDGSIYIRSRQTLFRIDGGTAPKPILKLALGEPALCTARDDGIWVVEASRIVRIHGDRASASLPSASKEPPTACAEDRLGRLWIVLFSGKLLRLGAAGWHEIGGAPAASRVWDLVRTPWGDPAFDTTGSEVGIVRGDRLTVIDLAPAGIGQRSMIAAGTRDLFLSGDGGLFRMRDGEWRRLSEARFAWLADLRSLVQTEDETWLISRHDISRVATADLDRAFQDPKAPLNRTLFDVQDGVTSSTQHPGFSGIQSAAGGDGRVWFLNRQGAAYFDPGTLERNALAPPVAIRSAASAGRVWRDPARLVLPPGTRAIDITYAGLSLAVPDRIMFRYRLEGVDDGWVEAGARRSASYANLSPGKYRFRVIAANNDGVWNTTGAALDFEIRPTFLQSWPFKLLCGAALLGLLWLAYSMRLRAVAGRIQLRMAERMAERERIARELHDTLIQSVQGLILRLQLIAEDLPADQAQRAPLEHALDTADTMLGQARDRVLNLRAADSAGDLENALAVLTEAQGRKSAPPIGLFVDGKTRAIDVTAKEELLLIIGEAVANARAHADASCIEIRLAFGVRHLTVSVSDDGRGIPPELVRNGGRPGHFGLAGMRERAQAIRGRLDIASRAGGGTCVTLKIPAHIAYVQRGWCQMITRGIARG